MVDFYQTIPQPLNKAPIAILLVLIAFGVSLSQATGNQLERSHSKYKIENEARVGFITKHEMLGCRCNRDAEQAGTDFSRIEPRYKDGCDNHFNNLLGFCAVLKQFLPTDELVYCVTKFFFNGIYHLRHLHKIKQTNFYEKPNIVPSPPDDFYYFESTNNKCDSFSLICETNDIEQLLLKTEIFNFTDSFQYYKTLWSRFTPHHCYSNEVEYDFDVVGQANYCRKLEDISVILTTGKDAYVRVGDLIPEDEESITTIPVLATTTTTTTNSVPDTNSTEFTMPKMITNSNNFPTTKFGLHEWLIHENLTTPSIKHDADPFNDDNTANVNSSSITLGIYISICANIIGIIVAIICCAKKLRCQPSQFELRACRYTPATQEEVVNNEIV